MQNTYPILTVILLKCQLSLDKLKTNLIRCTNLRNSVFLDSLSMESQPQNPEFRNNPEIFHLWQLQLHCGVCLDTWLYNFKNCHILCKLCAISEASTRQAAMNVQTNLQCSRAELLILCVVLQSHTGEVWACCFAKARIFYWLIYEPSYCNFPESRKKTF